MHLFGFLLELVNSSHRIEMILSALHLLDRVPFGGWLSYIFE